MSVASDPNGLTSINAILDAAAQNPDGSYSVYLPARTLVSIPDLFGTATPQELAIMVELIQALKLRAGL